MKNKDYNLAECRRYFDFPLPVFRAARRYANGFRHWKNRGDMIYLCFVFSEESDEILEINGTKRYDINPPLMRITLPGQELNHRKASFRNELFFAYDQRVMKEFQSLGLKDCNFRISPRFESMLQELEEALERCVVPGTADRIDRLAVMMGEEAMLSAMDIPRSSVPVENSAVARVEKYFQFHYSEKINLKGLMPKFGISLRTFYREWHRIFQQRPAHYLQELRMKEARMLLENSSMRICEIARSCGYESDLYFSRIFTAANGMTPMQYRRKCRKKEKTLPRP